MMVCFNCGNEINDNTTVCPFCGYSVENAGGVVETEAVDPSVKSAKIMGLIAIVLGSMGILGAWLLAIIGWIFGIVGLILAIVGKIKNKRSVVCVIGIVLSSVTLVCSFINSMLGMIFSLIYMFA